MIKAEFIVIDDKGEEHSLPAHFVVCDRCNGTGVHDHPAFSNGLTQEDFDEDPDFREEYMRGTYDVRCEVCKGERVVATPTLESLTPEQSQLLEIHYQAMHEAAAERRMRERGIQF